MLSCFPRSFSVQLQSSPDSILALPSVRAASLGPVPGTSRPLLLCLSPFLTGGPAPEAAWGSRSWGRSLCVSAQSELHQRGTYLHRSLRKRGQELQIDWFPLHSELVLCLEKGERDAVMPGGRMAEVIVLEQIWKRCWYWGWASRCAQPCRADLVQCWLGNSLVFNGWGQKIHNSIPGSVLASLMALSPPAQPAIHTVPICSHVVWGVMYLLAKLQVFMLEGCAMGSRLLTTRGPANLGFQMCDAQECALLLLEHSWFSTSSFFSSLLRALMLSEGADCCPDLVGSVWGNGCYH